MKRYTFLLLILVAFFAGATVYAQSSESSNPKVEFSFNLGWTLSDGVSVITFWRRMAIFTTTVDPKIHFRGVLPENI